MSSIIENDSEIYGWNMNGRKLGLIEHYWKEFQIQEEDLEFVYNYLLETEIPLTTEELVTLLVKERIRREKDNIKKIQEGSGAVYYPREVFNVGQIVQFPQLNWEKGKVLAIRPGYNPDLPPFQVMEVELENGEVKNFAMGLGTHALNQITMQLDEDPSLDEKTVFYQYGAILQKRIEEQLISNPDLVRIAGRWFPKALLVDIHVGHLNLAEAILEMEGGGPLSTRELMDQLDLPQDVNTKLLEFSLNFALQEDERFDEVGPAGKILWFLKRMEPQDVQTPPVYLQYVPQQYDQERVNSLLGQFEGSIVDELDAQICPKVGEEEATLALLYPHYRSGTLPLCDALYRFFPTAYESPRVQFTFVDGQTGEKFSGWVVRSHRYVYGLRDWFLKNECIPGSLITIRKGQEPGEVVIRANRKRPTREWMRTVIVGADGGIVFTMLKHNISTLVDERMGLVISDQNALDQVWSGSRQRTPLPNITRTIMRELAKLSPQGHVHAQELYAAVNVVKRVPPGLILSILLDNRWATHLGDLYFRFGEISENEE